MKQGISVRKLGRNLPPLARVREDGGSSFLHYTGISIPKYTESHPSIIIRQLLISFNGLFPLHILPFTTDKAV